MDWIYQAKKRKKIAGTCKHGTEPTLTLKYGGFPDHLNFLKGALIHAGG